MCGIIGILGSHEAAPLLVDALRRLEYRGYDSAGVATLHEGRLERRRAEGKLVNLSDALVRDPIRGQAGIGHTRWATHGAPTTTNAHPHRAGPVALVHNGIIENYREIRRRMEAEGRVFETETDTEAVAHLCAHHIEAGLAPADAARATITGLEGAFALLFLFEGEPDLLVAARFGPPLAVGYGQGEMYVGSDALALATLTDRVTYLEDGDTAVVRRSGVDIRDASGRQVDRGIRTVSVEAMHEGKGNYRHFMLKEIHDQPNTITHSLDAVLSPDRKGVVLPGLPDLTGITRVAIVACGTASYAGHVAKYWIESLARIPVEIDVASEYRYREPPVGPETLAIFVSQSGETADTLAALRYAKSQGAQIVSVVNQNESSIARESAGVLPIRAGAEIGVASTKAFTGQLVVLAALAIHLGRARGHISPDREAELTSALTALPGLVNQALGLEAEIETIAADLATARDVLFLGRGPLYPLALEGALKLKEISYIHAEGYAAGEMKHGPIALIDEKVPVIVFAPTDPLFEKTVSNVQETMARGGKVLFVSDAAGLRSAAQGAWRRLAMPACDPFIAPILYAIPAQLLAYCTAVTKGTDVDQPRNLAKSVTVE